MVSKLSNEKKPVNFITWNYDVVFVYRNGHYFIKKTT